MFVRQLKKLILFSLLGCVMCIESYAATTAITPAVDTYEPGSDWAKCFAVSIGESSTVYMPYYGNSFHTDGIDGTTSIYYVFNAYSGGFSPLSCYMESSSFVQLSGIKLLDSDSYTRDLLVSVYSSAGFTDESYSFSLSGSSSTVYTDEYNRVYRLTDIQTGLFRFPCRLYISGVNRPSFVVVNAYVSAS